MSAILVPHSLQLAAQSWVALIFSDAYGPLIPKIADMREKGQSFDAIAIALNSEGHVTLTGSPFSAATVFKIFKRLGGQNGRASGKHLGRQAATATAK